MIYSAFSTIQITNHASLQKAFLIIINLFGFIYTVDQQYCSCSFHFIEEYVTCELHIVASCKEVCRSCVTSVILKHTDTHTLIRHFSFYPWRDSFCYLFCPNLHSGMCKYTAADGRSRVSKKMLKQLAPIEVYWGAAHPGKQDTSGSILKQLMRFDSVLIIIVDK